MGLGGGSGVVSFALLRKQHELTSAVVDVETVCQTGREIASEHGLAKQITYLAADYLQDDLPSGFDMVLLCDVGSFSDILFQSPPRLEYERPSCRRRQVRANQD